MTATTGEVVPLGAAKAKVDWTSIDTTIKHAGREIVLPGDPTEMDIDDAILTLHRIKELENQKFDVQEMINGAPWDALVALYRSLQMLYGVVIAQDMKTMFGNIKPDLITVHTGYNDEDRIQIPCGQMKLPNFADPVKIGFHQQGAYIVGTVRRRDRARLVEIANLARKLMREESIYKTKAIRLSVDDEDGELDLSTQPEFIDLRNVREDDAIHTAETTAMIRTNIFAPLKNTEACRTHKVPLKRGILLEGRYGTGKTITARVTAKVATDNGWTFIMLDRSQGLRAAIEFARSYQPCVIFAEDIDRCADREEEGVNDLVNMLDGLITKDMEMMVVLTTNFIEKIDRALLRPGRFDAIVSIQPPDAETAIRLIHAYGRTLIKAESDLTEVGEIIAGQIPATIREVVERAKLAMLTENRDHLTPDDLRISAIGMKRHIDLLLPPTNVKTPRDLLFEGLVGAMAESKDGSPSRLADIEEKVAKIAELVPYYANDLKKRVGALKDPILAAASGSKEAYDNTVTLLERVPKASGVTPLRLS